MDDEDDLVLAIMAGEGDRKAFDVLVERHKKYLWAALYKPIGGDDREDAFQEALLKLWVGLPRFRGNSEFRTWAWRTVRNTSINLYTTATRRIQTADEGEESPAVETETPEDIVSADETAKRIEEGFEQMPPFLRTTLRLRQFEGLSYEEVAESMGCALGTVRSRLHRGRKLIGDAVNAGDAHLG